MPGQLEELKGIIVSVLTIVIILTVVIILTIVIVVIVMIVVSVFILIFSTKVARSGAEVDVSSNDSPTARSSRGASPPHVLPLQLLLLLWRPGSLVLLAQELFT